jgi:hypothetical protein
MAEAVHKYRGLSIAPSAGSNLRIVGNLAFRATGPGGLVVEDEYEIDLSIPPEFPAALPRVWETGGRIPKDYHKLEGNALCLGAPTEIRMQLLQSSTLLAFLERFVIPYLFGYSVFSKSETMPFGELLHGDAGIRQCLAEMFGAHAGEHPEEFLRLAGMKKRAANKWPCPCGSGRRLGKCHNRTTNQLRRRIGRQWFRSEYGRVVKAFESNRRRRSTPPARGRVGTFTDAEVGR